MNNSLIYLNPHDGKIKNSLNQHSNIEAFNNPNSLVAENAHPHKISGMQFQQNIGILDLENYQKINNHNHNNNNNNFIQSDSILNLKFTNDLNPIAYSAESKFGFENVSSFNPSFDNRINNFYRETLQNSIDGNQKFFDFACLINFILY